MTQVSVAIIPRSAKRRFGNLPLLHRYILGQFVVTFLMCLFASTLLFLVFDFFEKAGLFLRENVSFGLVLLFMLSKIPLVIQLMTPVAVLVATLLSVGRLAQHSEITAMRACGVSVFWLAEPLIFAGLTISVLMFAAGETIIPWASQYGEEIYHFDIKKKIETGQLSRANFWYRSGNRFYDIGYYDSQHSSLQNISVFSLSSDFRVVKRIDAKQADWHGSSIGWVMKGVVETVFSPSGKMFLTSYQSIPLVIPEKPADFYNKRRDPETFNIIQLRDYITKLRNEGVPVTKYLVELQSKISFPFVNIIVVLIAFPFALIPARSGTLTLSFIAGVSVGFGYYVVHALSTSLGSAELLPVILAAWSANILLTCIAGYFMASTEIM